jgi:hypothetical protein
MGCEQMAVTRGVVVARVFFRWWLCPDPYHGFFVACFFGRWLAMVMEGGGAAAGFCFIKIVCIWFASGFGWMASRFWRIDGCLGRW